MNIAELLSNAPPVIAVMILIAWGINRFLSFFEKRRQSVDAHDQYEATVENGKKIERVDNSLNDHIRDEDRRAGEQVAAIRSLEMHLVSERVRSNPFEADNDMPVRTQKLMIEYQWSYCRDQTCTIIANSVRRNSIAGREEQLIRRLSHALKNATMEARGSLNALGTFKYPVDDLFARAPQLWADAVRLAIPIYHRRVGDMSVEEALADFNLQVRNLFALALQQFFLESEDVETGVVYERGSGSAHATAELPILAALVGELRRPDETTVYSPAE